MSDKIALTYKNTRYKEFKEFNKTDKDRIASIVETKYKEHVLSPIVESYVYASSRAVDYGDRFGTIHPDALWEDKINKNLDYFDVTVMDEIHPTRKIPRWATFRGCGMYLDHQSQHAENSVGFIFDAFDVRDKYDDMHVTLLFGIDKTKAPKVARSLETYPEKVGTSMGCSITGASCTVCGAPINASKTDNCDHIKYMRGGRVGGVKVAEFLHGVEFFEDSIVSVPACSTAYVLDAVSKIIPGRLLKIAASSDSNIVTAQIMTSLYASIKSAKTPQERSRLMDQMDTLLSKLRSMEV